MGASVGAEGQDETAVCHGVVAGLHSCRGCERDASGLLGCSGLVFATAEADKGLVEVVQPGAEHGLPVASGVDGHEDDQDALAEILGLAVVGIGDVGHRGRACVRAVGVAEVEIGQLAAGASEEIEGLAVGVGEGEVRCARPRLGYESVQPRSRRRTGGGRPGMLARAAPGNDDQQAQERQRTLSAPLLVRSEAKLSRRRRCLSCCRARCRCSCRCPRG